MNPVDTKNSVFEKVGECLYRYKPTGCYYARVKKAGKEIRKSLQTTDRALAKRKLADFQTDLSRIDLSAAKLSLSALGDRYLETIAHQKAKTVRRKTDIVERIKVDWPGGSAIQIGKVLPPHPRLARVVPVWSGILQPVLGVRPRHVSVGRRRPTDRRLAGRSDQRNQAATSDP